MDDQSFFAKPSVRATLTFFGMIVAYFILGFFLPLESQLTYDFWDTLLCGAGLVFWLAFFAQFILPLNTTRQRLDAVGRIMEYLSGLHGPAIFVENGVVREQHGERNKRGPGVIWLDSASAAMLRTTTRFTRVVGPGVHFTRYSEYIAATVDLHRQVHAIGLQETDDPFTTDKENEAVQKRHWETRAVTRDGIEMGASLSVTFRINPKPDEGGTKFGFNADNTRRAITDAVTQGAALNQPVWSPMPGKMTADLWREYISRFRVNELFEFVPGKEGVTGLQLILSLIRGRLTAAEVEGLDDFGKPTGLSPKSTEFERLKDMGLEVIGVQIKRIAFRPEVEDNLTSRWKTLWLKNSQYERDQLEKIRRLAETKSQEEAIMEYATLVSGEYTSPIPPRNKAEALYHLTHATARSVIRSSGLMKRLSKSDTRILSELANWLEDKR